MGLLSSDVESIEIKFDQVNYKFRNRKRIALIQDGKPYLAGDEVAGTVTAKFKKDVKVK